MRKRISEMTQSDKYSYLEAVKRATEAEQGLSWTIMSKKIQTDIDTIFDDEKFAKMDPDSRIDASYARKEFGDKKPELVDYLLWMSKFVTKSDIVEW